MELGPIVRTLIRNKVRFILIGCEVALTLAIVVNCVNMMLELKGQMDRPTGIDESNLLVVRNRPFSPDFRDEGYFKNSRQADLELLRSLPGVRAAEAFSAIPLSGSGSSSGYKPMGAEYHTLATGVFDTGEHFLETLDVALIAGRGFQKADFHDAKSKNVIVTNAFAEKLFPEGEALGRQIQGRTAENPHTIIGIIDQMHGSWPMWTYAEHVTFFPELPGRYNWGVYYLVRTNPGQRDPLAPTIEERLLALNNGRNVTVETLEEIKADTYEGNFAVIQMLSVVVVLLIFVTTLGIVGITSFSVTERVHYIGTRRALGARKLDIVRFFLTENWIITTSGIVVGMLAAYALNYVLVNFVGGALLDWRIVLGGVFGMWAAGQLAALFPALRGAAISPAAATKSL